MEKQQKSKNFFVIKNQIINQFSISLSPKYQSQRLHSKIPEIVELEQNLTKPQSLKNRNQKQQKRKRCRSSESSYEGTLNKRYYFIFQTIPSYGSYYQRHQFNIKKWKKIIVAIQSIIYILKIAANELKIRSTCPPKMMISHYSIHHHSYPQSPSTRNRNKSSSLEIKNRKISFGEKIQTFMIKEKAKADFHKKISHLQFIKNQNTKLNRILSQKAISLQCLFKTAENIKLLPSIGNIEHCNRQLNLQKQTKKPSLKQKRLQ